MVFRVSDFKVGGVDVSGVRVQGFRSWGLWGLGLPISRKFHSAKRKLGATQASTTVWESAVMSPDDTRMTNSGDMWLTLENKLE